MHFTHVDNISKSCKENQDFCILCMCLWCLICCIYNIMEYNTMQYAKNIYTFTYFSVQRESLLQHSSLFLFLRPRFQVLRFHTHKHCDIAILQLKGFSKNVHGVLDIWEAILARNNQERERKLVSLMENDLSNHTQVNGFHIYFLKPLNCGRQVIIFLIHEGLKLAF